jgi:autotransporter-associated beta strand protein
MLLHAKSVILHSKKYRISTHEEVKKQDILALLVLPLLIGFTASFAQAAARYSVANGNWNSTSTWSATSGGAPGASYPVAGDNVTIENNYTVTVTANAACATMTIAAGSQLTVNPNYTMTFTSTVTVNGTWLSQSTRAVSGGTITFASGSVYQLDVDAGTIPTATWDANSTCLITGVTSSTLPGGFSQNFGNVTWNCTGQTSGNSLSNSNYTYSGTLTIQSTGTSTLQLVRGSYTGNAANYVQTGGSVFIGSASTATKTLNVTNAFSISGGTFDMCTANPPAASTFTLNVGGNFTISGGSFQKSTAANATCNVNFNGTTTQTYSYTAGTLSGLINFSIPSGATVDFGTSVISSGVTGTFTIASGGSLITANTAGITTTGATGSIQVTGTRTYTSGANYTYNGTANQATGNGLSQNAPADVTINNPGNTVTLGATQTISGNLTVSSGTFDLSTFTINRSAAGGTLTVSNGATLKIGGTGTIPSNYSTHSIGSTSTIEYAGTNQSVAVLNSSQNYGNLTISGSGTKTLAGTVGVAGNLTISSSTLDLSSYTANRTSAGGTLTVSGGATLKIGGTGSIPSNYSTHSIGSTSTIEYSGTNQSVAVLNSSQNYGNLTISGSGTATLAGIVGVAGNLTISSGTFDLSSYTANRTAAGGTLTVSNGTTLSIGGTGTLPSNYSTHSIGATSTVNYYGTTQSVATLNSSQNYGNLTTSGSGTATLAGTVGVAGNLTISSGTFDLSSYTANRTAAGGTLTVSNGALLKIGGTGTIPSNYSTHSIGSTSTIEYSGTNQSVAVLNSSQNYGNLTISGSGTKTLAGAETVSGTLTISAGTLADGGFTLSVNGSITNSASHTGAGKILLIGGSTTHALSGGGSYTNLQVNDANGATLSSNLTVNGTLTFTTGSITTGSYTVSISSSGTVSRTSGHVVGNLQKYIATGATSATFEIGDASNYTPINISFASVTTAGSLRASTTAGDHPNIGSSSINASKTANRYWTMTNSGIVFTTCSATFNFVSGDVDVGANPSAFVVGEYGGGLWTYPTVGTTTATSTQATGLTAFGDFQVGESLAKTWDGGAGTNNWGDAANWNPDGVPTSSNDVSLTGANTININVAAATNNLTLNNASLTLTILSGNSLTVSGSLTVTTGTLNTQASFPTVSGTISIAGGTIGYTASSGSQTVAVQPYSNLTISGGGTKTLAGNITPSGDLTISAGTFDLGTYTANRTSAGGTLTVSNGATLLIGGTGTLPSNYSTHSIGATSTINYYGTTQSVAALNSSQDYGSLTISGSGTKTLMGNENVAGDLTISAGTFDLGSYTINRASAGGTLTVSSGATLLIAGTGTLPANYSTHSIGSTSTINYSGTSQTVATLNSAQNYGYLTISGSGTKTLAGNVGVVNDLTISAGTFDLGTNTCNRTTAGGTFSLSTGAIMKAGGSSGGVTGSNFPSNYSTNTLSGTVEFSGTSTQTIPVLNYTNLAFSNAGTKSINSSITATGTVTINFGAAVSVASGVTLQVKGSISNAGTLTNSGTVLLQQ